MSNFNAQAHEILKEAYKLGDFELRYIEMAIDQMAESDDGYEMAIAEAWHYATRNQKYQLVKIHEQTIIQYIETMLRGEAEWSLQEEK